MNSLFRRGRILLLLALALALSVPSMAVAQLAEQNDLQGESPTFEAPADTQAVPEQIIVKFEENVDPATKADVRRAEGLEKEKDLKVIGAEVDKVKGRSVEDAIRDLNGNPDVVYAERDYIVHATGYAEEPLFPQLWGLDNTGQNGCTPDVDINGLEASAVTQGDPNLLVAVIDTGVAFSTPTVGTPVDQSRRVRWRQGDQRHRRRWQRLRRRRQRRGLLKQRRQPRRRQ